MTPSQYRALKPEKKSKYRNEKGKVDGIKFDSLREKKRYGQLKMLELAGKIEELTLQKSYPLEVNGKLICTYRADFVYRVVGRWVCEDVKGVRTPAYRIKSKLMYAIYGIEILET